MSLTTVSNRKLTLLRKLNRKKYRQEEQFFLLEGARAVEQVLENKAISVEALFFDESQQYWNQSKWKSVAQNVEAFTMPADQFAEISDTDTPQGVLAMCGMPEEASPKELRSQSGIIIALDGIQDPGNAGTIIRTASWFGAKGILSGKGTVDFFHPKVVRATAGATGVVPLVNGELIDLLPVFESVGWSVFILDSGDDAVALSEMASVSKAIIVVGNEARGCDPELFTDGRQKARIPPPKGKAGVESLNAAIATSIALYDFSGKLE